jgi:hypothetical protein
MGDAFSDMADGQEHGTPSPQMQAFKNAKSMDQGGIVDTDPGYIRVTDAAPESGIFSLVGGYVGDDGRVQNEVELRAMSGDEEDLLGSIAQDPVQKMNAVMARCVTRLGEITDKGQIHQAVSSMPSGTRTHLLLCLRIASHWKAEKDIYTMNVRCPMDNCGKEGQYSISLLDLELYEPEDPTKTSYMVELPYSEKKVHWRVMGSSQDAIMSQIAKTDRGRAMTYAIMVRLLEIDGEDMELTARDFFGGDTTKARKMRLSKKARQSFDVVRQLPTGDRQFLRNHFNDNEPAVNTDIDVECVHCQREFVTFLDVAQPDFFFPRGTSQRWKPRRSF